MRIVVAALTLALLTGPGYAEMNQTTARSDAQKKADKEADEAYKAMIKNVPDKARNTDPWNEMRGGDTAANSTTTPTGTTSSHRAHRSPNRQEAEITQARIPLIWHLARLRTGPRQAGQCRGLRIVFGRNVL